MAEELLFSGPKKSSFAKSLYFGLLDSTQIFPYPRLSPDEQKESDAFLETVSQFAEQEIDPAAIDRNAAIPDTVIKRMATLGILGLSVPKEYGGLGMSQHTYCRAVEIIARQCSSTALFINVHQSIGLKALLLFGTETQRKKWLPSLAKGEITAAFSLTEPNAGSDASGIETRAVFIPEKNSWRINGRKQWTTNGSVAQVLTVMAKTEVETPHGKEDKITAFLVNPTMPGFIVSQAALEKLGMRGTKTANLEFKNLEVPAENVLGPLGGGLKVALTVLDYGRTTFGAMCTGSAKLLLEKAIDHAIHRYQFHRPLASFALVKKKIATMSALVYAMDATTYMTAGLVDSHAEDIMLESAMLKVFTSDSLWSILYDTMQIFGGRSFFTDEPYERMMRDARLNQIGEGSNEVMRAFIGAVGMRDVGLQLKNLSSALFNPFKHSKVIQDFVGQFWRSLKYINVPVKSPLLRQEAHKLENAIRRFGFSVKHMLIRHRENIVEKQLLLDRIASTAMAIYTITSVISKLDADLTATKNHEPLKRDIATAKLYCQIAFDSIHDNLATLTKNYDADIESLSDLITGIKTP